MAGLQPSGFAALNGGRHLQAIPGRKSLVWIGGGIPLFLPRVSPVPNGMPANPMSGGNLERAVRDAARRLARSGMALYGIGARGCVAPGLGRWRPIAGRLTGGAEIFIGQKPAAGGVRFRQSRIHAALAPARMDRARPATGSAARSSPGDSRPGT